MYIGYKSVKNAVGGVVVGGTKHAHNKHTVIIESDDADQKYTIKYKVIGGEKWILGDDEISALSPTPISLAGVVSIQVTAFTDEGAGDPHVPDWQPSDSPFNVIIITEDIGCQ